LSSESFRSSDPYNSGKNKHISNNNNFNQHFNKQNKNMNFNNNNNNKQGGNYHTYQGQANKIPNSNEFMDRNSHPINMMTMINGSQMQGNLQPNQFFNKNQLISSMKGYEFNMLNFQNNPNLSKFRLK
jgi:hypothetical protein